MSRVIDGRITENIKFVPISESISKALGITVSTNMGRNAALTSREALLGALKGLPDEHFYALIRPGFDRSSAILGSIKEIFANANIEEERATEIQNVLAEAIAERATQIQEGLWKSPSRAEAAQKCSLFPMLETLKPYSLSYITPEHQAITILTSNAEAKKIVNLKDLQDQYDNRILSLFNASKTAITEVADRSLGARHNNQRSQNDDEQSLSGSDSFANAATPSAGKITLSRTLTKNPTVDGIDERIVGAILGKSALGQDSYRLPVATDQPPTIKVYGGIISFNNNEITTGDFLATEDGEVDFIGQIRALFTSAGSPPSTPSETIPSVTVDFVVSEKSRGHFSTLSVTINPANQKITDITHEDTLYDADKASAQDSLQKKFHAAVKAAIEKGGILSQPVTELDIPIRYSRASQLQHENTCADRVMLSMMQAHHPKKLQEMLLTFSDNCPVPITQDWIGEKVAHLLSLENEAELRRFTCHVVYQDRNLVNRVDFTNGAALSQQSSSTTPGSAASQHNQQGTTAASAAIVTYTGHDLFFDASTTDKVRKQWLDSAFDVLTSAQFATAIQWRSNAGTRWERSDTFDCVAKMITINLKAVAVDTKQPIFGNITLTRQDGIGQQTGAPTATWTCTADFKNPNLTADQQEKMRFDLIALESLALRMAQAPHLPASEAARIGIININEQLSNKRASTLFLYSGSAPCILSPREERLIQAHLDAGYKEVHYNNFIFKGVNPIAQSAPITPVVVQYTTPPPATSTQQRGPNTPNQSNTA